MTSNPPRTVRVHVQATAEEIAAIVAALDAAVHAVRTSSEPMLSAYERWRQTRLKALRAR